MDTPTPAPVPHLTATPKFVLRREDDNTLIAHIYGDLTGFFAGRTDLYAEYEAEELPEGPEPLTFTATGVRLDPTADKSDELGNAHLEILDVNGAPIGTYWLGGLTLDTLDAEGADAAALSAWVTSYPDVDAAAIWDAWRTDRPTTTNEWARLLPPGRREAWLEVALKYEPYEPYESHESHEPYEPAALAAGREPAGAANPDHVTLDGRHITDLASFFCALGEATNGPGGYYGANFMALHECLRGGHGPAAPFTLYWQRASVARSHLTRTAETLTGLRSYFDMTLEVLQDAGVEVVLED